MTRSRYVVNYPNNSKETRALWNEFARQEKISEDWEKFKEQERQKRNPKPFKIYPEWKFLAGVFAVFFLIWLAEAMKDGVL